MRESWLSRSDKATVSAQIRVRLHCEYIAGCATVVQANVYFLRDQGYNARD